MKFRSLTVIALLFSIALTGCVNKLNSLEGNAFDDKNQAKVTKAFEKVEDNMSEKQVLALLGKPKRINTYKAAPAMKIPTKHNTETGRQVWYYPGSGSITFKIDHHTRRRKVVTIFKLAETK